MIKEFKNEKMIYKRIKGSSIKERKNKMIKNKRMK